MGMLAAATLVAAGCSTTSSPSIGSTTLPPGSTSTTSLRTDPGGASDPSTTTAVASTTTTEGPSSPFSSGSSPVIGPQGQGWNNNFVVPGPVIDHDGTLFMFYVGHTYTPPNIERGQVGVATSVDGEFWAFTNGEPLFDGSEYEWTEGGVYPTSGMIMDDGTWVLWFSAAPRAFSSRALVIGRATAPGPDGPWTVDPEPVLTGGGDGTWNAKGVSHPSVIRLDDEFRMYFDGHIDDIDSERDRAIGLATSADGVHWDLHDDPATDGLFSSSDPVFRAGDVDAWDGARVMAPEVSVVGDQFIMVYLSSRRRTDKPGFLQDFGYAVSTDGVSWERSDEPVLGNRGEVAFITNISSTVIGDSLVVYYDAAGNVASSFNAILETAAPLEALFE